MKNKQMEKPRVLVQYPPAHMRRSFVPPVEGRSMRLRVRTGSPTRGSIGSYNSVEKEWLPLLRKKIRSKFIANYPLAHIDGPYTKRETTWKLPEIKPIRKPMHNWELKRDHLKLPVQTEYIFPLNNVIKLAPHDGFFWLSI